MGQGLAKGVQEGASPLLAWLSRTMEEVSLSLIWLGARRALLGIFGVIFVHHMSHWGNVIEVLGENNSVFSLAVKSPSQTFPVNVMIGGLIPFVLFAQVLPVEGLCASPLKLSLEFVGDCAMGEVPLAATGGIDRCLRVVVIIPV